MRKKEKTFTWCIRYYNVKTGNIKYITRFGWTAREIEEHVVEFIQNHEDYSITVFKNYKSF